MADWIRVRVLSLEQIKEIYGKGLKMNPEPFNKSKSDNQETNSNAE